MKKIKLAVMSLGLTLLLALSACGKKEAETTAAPVTEAVTEAVKESAGTEENTGSEGTDGVGETAGSDETDGAQASAGADNSTGADNSAGADKEEATYVDDGKKTGRYELFAIGEDGEYFDAKELMGEGAYLEFLEDGRGSICLDEKPDEFTWVEKNGRIILTAEGEKLECTIEKGLAYLNLDEGAGMYFAKPGADTSVVKVKGLEELLGEMLLEGLESMEAEETKKTEKKAE